MPPRNGRSIVRQILTMAVVMVVGAALSFILSVLRLIPVSLGVIVQVVAAAILGALAIELVARAIRGMTSKAFGVRPGSELAIAFRFVGYAVLAFVVLALIGITGTALLAGGRSRASSSVSRGPRSSRASSEASCS